MTDLPPLPLKVRVAWKLWRLCLHVTIIADRVGGVLISCVAREIKKEDQKRWATGSIEDSYVSNITFSEEDVEKLLGMFTPEEQRFIDKFLSWMYAEEVEQP